MLKRLVPAPQGFTLLELLIVSVIMLVVTGGAIATLATFRDRQQALVTTKRVQQMLWSAQTKARVRETPVGCSPLQGYRVQITATAATLHAMCGSLPASANATARQSYTFEPGTTRSVTGTATFMFWTLERGVNQVTNAIPVLTAPMAVQTVSFCNGSGGACSGTSPIFSFTVNGYGAISSVDSDTGASGL